MSSEVKILDGNTFVVSDEAGDIEASLTDPTGLFSFDTRFLSKWVLTINGQRLNPLSVDDLHYFETRFFLVPGTGTVYVDAKMSVIRQRAVGGGFREELTILNHDDKAVDLTVRIEADCDFADLFEVKDALQKKGDVFPQCRRRQSDLGLSPRDLRERDDDIGLDRGQGGRAWPDVQGAPRAARPVEHRPDRGPGPRCGQRRMTAKSRGRIAAGRSGHAAQSGEVARGGAAPGERLGALKSTYQRSLVDLAALRFSPPVLQGTACRRRDCRGS